MTYNDFRTLWKQTESRFPQNPTDEIAHPIQRLANGASPEVVKYLLEVADHADRGTLQEILNRPETFQVEPHA